MATYKKRARGSVIKTHQWTKDEITTLAKLWTSSSIEDMADELGVDPTQVVYMGSQIRLEYPDLVPKKHRKGHTRNLIREALGGK